MGTPSRYKMKATANSQATFIPPTALNFINSTDWRLYQNGKKLTAADYSVTSSQINITNPSIISKCDNIDAIRHTVVPDNVSGNELIYALQEYSDAALLLGANDDGGIACDLNDASLPRITISPFDSTEADSLGASPNAYGISQFAYQSRTRAAIDLQASQTVGWWSTTFTQKTGDDPQGKHTNSALSVIAMGRLNPGTDGKPQASVALTVDSEIAASFLNGKAEAIVSSAKHASSLPHATYGINTSMLTFFSTTPGPSKNGQTFAINAPSGTGHIDTTVSPIVIYPSTIAGGMNADTIAAQWTNDAIAPGIATVKAAGSGVVTPTTPTTLITLAGGVNADGKLVCYQASLQPAGQVTTGPGSYNATSGALSLTGYPNYGYTANSNGNYPGFAAFMTKSRDDDNDLTKGLGWYNGFAVDVDSISTDGRAFWWVGRFSIIPYTVGTTPSSKMAIGHDVPQTVLHVKLPEEPEIRIQNSASTSNNMYAGAITFYAGPTTPLQCASIASKLLLTSGSESRLEFSTSTSAGFLPALYIEKGMYTPTASGADQGAESLNVLKLFVDGRPISKPATTSRTDTVDFSLTYGTDGPEVYHELPAGITTTINCTINNTNSFDGARLRIVRTTGGTGVIKIKDASGTILKNLSTNQWADFTYRLSKLNWVESAAGAL